MKETNKLTPEYFYANVAKKLNLPVEVVKEVYSKYTSRLAEVCREDSKIMVRGLGSFEISPRKVVHSLYNYDKHVLNNEDIFFSREYEDHYKVKQLKQKIKDIFNYIEQIEHKYEHIEKSLEKFWANSRGLKKLFDKKGNYREYSEREDVNLQELPE